ncbi:MAG: 4Fe-4S dicluster domain-containing protein [Clostridiales bacterium]
MKIVTADPRLCVVCRNCERACAFAKSKGDILVKHANMRVNYYPEEVACMPWTCIHCEKPWCMEVCPAGAISRDEKTHAVKIDSSLCAGCKMCMLACPFGSIHFDSEALVSIKCDLCDGDPKCVQFCISGALQYQEVDDAFDYNRKSFDNNLKSLLNLKRKGDLE